MTQYIESLQRKNNIIFPERKSFDCFCPKKGEDKLPFVATAVQKMNKNYALRLSA